MNEKRGKLIRQIYELEQKEKEVSIKLNQKKCELEKMDSGIDAEKYIGKNFIVFLSDDWNDWYYIKNVSSAEVWLNGPKPPTVRIKADCIFSVGSRGFIREQQGYCGLSVEPERLDRSEVTLKEFEKRLKAEVDNIKKYVDNLFINEK
jgi:hypothetical protein